MSSGGGGGNGTTRYEWNDTMAPYWGGLLQNAGQQAQTPYSQYGGERVAGFNGNQNDAFGAVRNYVADPSGFLYGRGVDQFYGTLEGDYLSGDKANPYANQKNDYEGNSPQFETMLDAGSNDIAKAYQTGTAADTTRMFNLAGAFGGSAHENAVANNEAALGKTLTNYETQMRNDQFNRSAGLQDARLTRGNADYEAERQRQMTAGNASQADQGLTLDRYNALLGVGGMQQGQQQRYDDVGYGNWQDQNNYGKNQASWLASILSAAQGGLPPSQITSQGGNNLATGLGGALAAYGLFRS